MNEKDILAELTQRRDEVLNKLRAREPDLVGQMIQFNAAIVGIKAESKPIIKSDEYSGFRKPSGALFAYLDKMKKPQPRDKMCQAIIDGGYTDDTDNPYWSLMRGVYYQIKKKRLIERNELIGKSDWPKEVFKAEP